MRARMNYATDDVLLRHARAEFDHAAMLYAEGRETESEGFCRRDIAKGFDKGHVAYA